MGSSNQALRTQRGQRGRRLVARAKFSSFCIQHKSGILVCVCKCHLGAKLKADEPPVQWGAAFRAAGKAEGAGC